VTPFVPVGAISRRSKIEMGMIELKRNISPGMKDKTQLGSTSRQDKRPLQGSADILHDDSFVFILSGEILSL
jgi:hypothetical protein